MNSILSYPGENAPYQSCWLILIKALIINNLSVRALLAQIHSNNNDSTCSARLFETSLEDIVVALSPNLRLMDATVTQAQMSSNFYKVNKGSNLIIRHCEICIDNNYHCSIFHNPLIDHCPVHNKPLVFCLCCTYALRDSPVRFRTHFSKSATCQHLKRMMAVRVPLVDLPDADCTSFALKGHQYRAWIAELKDLDLGMAKDVIPKIGNTSILNGSKFYFEYVRRKIGLPFDTFYDAGEFGHEIKMVNYTSSVKSNVQIFSCATNNKSSSSDATKSDQSGDSVTQVQDIARCMKSMRRHFFNNYVRPHRRCFKSLSKMSHAELNRLDLASRCSCVSGYCLWLVSMSGVTTMPSYFNLRNNDSTLEIFGEVTFGLKHSVKDILIAQYVSFFDIWGALEIVDQAGAIYSEVVVGRLSVASESFACMNASFTMSRQEEVGGSFIKHKSYVISPSYLRSRSLHRCCSRPSPKLFVEKGGAQDLYVPSAHGILRFIDRRSSRQQILTLKIW